MFKFLNRGSLSKLGSKNDKKNLFGSILESVNLLTDSTIKSLFCPECFI